MKWTVQTNEIEQSWVNPDDPTGLNWTVFKSERLSNRKIGGFKFGHLMTKTKRSFEHKLDGPKI